MALTLSAGPVNSRHCIKYPSAGNRPDPGKNSLCEDNSHPLMICLCTLRFYVDVLTPGTNFIALIEFYGAIFWSVAVVHWLLIRMRARAVTSGIGRRNMDVHSNGDPRHGYCRHSDLRLVNVADSTIAFVLERLTGTWHLLMYESYGYNVLNYLSLRNKIVNNFDTLFVI